MVSIDQNHADLCIASADIGSVAAGNFGWAARCPAAPAPSNRGESMDGLVETVARELQGGARVALGFECPLFVPLRADPVRLTAQRVGENGRPWSAGAGCGSLATGLVQVTWVLERLAQLDLDVRATLEWEQFRSGEANLLLWEAFVSGAAKATHGSSLHSADADRAVHAFEAALPDVPASNAIQEAEVYSLVGASLLRSGLSRDLAILAEPCLVIRA